MNILQQFLGSADVKLGLGDEPYAKYESPKRAPVSVAEYIAQPMPTELTDSLPSVPARVEPSPTVALSPSKANAARFVGADANDAAPELYSHISAVEKKYNIPAGLLVSIKDKGEKSGSNATSPVGAQGIFQFMPATWAQYGTGSPRDPYAAADAAGKFVADLMKQYGGNPAAAVAHYNGGYKMGRMVQEGRAPAYKETSNYLKRVLS